MRNKILGFFLLGFLVIPNVTFASWWNVFSWGIFQKPNTQTQTIQNPTVEPDTKSNIATTTISTSTPKTVIKTTPVDLTSNGKKKIIKKIVTPPQTSIAPVSIKTSPSQPTPSPVISNIPRLDNRKYVNPTTNQDNISQPIPTFTPSLVSTPPPTPIQSQPTEPIDPYSDYVFVNTSPAVGADSQWQIQITIPATTRDIRVKKAVFKVSDEDATTLDTIGVTVGGSPLWLGMRYNNKILYYTSQLQRIDKNTFTYEASNGSSGISLGQLPLFLALYTLSPASFDANKALMANIKLPMSEWEIIDQSNGKPVKIQ